jgi:hypothetical protein
MSHDYTDQNQNLPPRALATDPEQAVFSVVTGAAASSDIWAGYTADAGGLNKPQGKCWIELEATAQTAYVRFTRTALTATTAASGAAVVVGSPRRFYVDPEKDLFMDIFAAGAGTLKWRRVGSIITRSRT